MILSREMTTSTNHPRFERTTPFDKWLRDENAVYPFGDPRRIWHDEPLPELPVVGDGEEE